MILQSSVQTETVNHVSPLSMNSTMFLYVAFAPIHKKSQLHLITFYDKCHNDTGIKSESHGKSS